MFWGQGRSGAKRHVSKASSASQGKYSRRFVWCDSVSFLLLTWLFSAHTLVVNYWCLFAIANNSTQTINEFVTAIIWTFMLICDSVYRVRRVFHHWGQGEHSMWSDVKRHTSKARFIFAVRRLFFALFVCCARLDLIFHDSNGKENTRTFFSH